MDTSEIITERPEGGGQAGAAVPALDGASGPAGEGRECSCPKCGLYKWYPPLLLLSTLMAAVFCCMYITKPVFLSQPQERHIPQAHPAVQERQEGPRQPPTAEHDGNLDPAGAGLPGENAVASGGSDAVLEALSDGFEPLVHEQNGPSLFQPFSVSDDEGLAAFPPGEKHREEPGPQAGAAESGLAGDTAAESLPEDQSDIELVGPPRPEPLARSDEDDYRLRASFIAEFVDPAKSLAGPDTGPDETNSAP